MTEKTENSRPTQAERVLKYLEDHRGEWINGRVFLRDLFLTQYHARIWELQNNRTRYVYEGNIEASEFTDGHGFKSYRLAHKPVPISA